MKTVKRAALLCAALLLFLCTALPAAAAPARLADRAGLLSDSEAGALCNLLDEISARRDADMVIVTVDTLDGKTPREYADDYYDDNGFGRGAEHDGVLLLVCMGTRDWYISTTGAGITAITDAGRTYIAEQFVDLLSDGAYAAALTAFAEQCDVFFEQAATGTPYDIGNLPREPFAVGTHLLLALAIGLTVALIVTGIMRAKLKTVRGQAAADSYIKAGSLQLTQSRDLFLYTHVDRRERPREDSHSGGSGTHVSSSGTTHGGGGGKF